MNVDGSIADCAFGDSDARLECATTTQQPDHGQPADKKDYFTVEDGVRFAGKHLLIDIKGGRNLNDLAFIEDTLRKCVVATGATLLHIHLHHFTPHGGVSGVVVLAESHISIHTWPEEEFAALDVFMCGDTHPEKAVEVLQDAFQPQNIDVQIVKRGRANERG